MDFYGPAANPTVGSVIEQDTKGGVLEDRGGVYEHANFAVGYQVRRGATGLQEFDIKYPEDKNKKRTKCCIIAMILIPVLIITIAIWIALASNLAIKECSFGYTDKSLQELEVEGRRIYDEAAGLAWDQVSQHIADKLRPHFCALEQAGIKTDKSKVTFLMWNGQTMSCDYEGQVNSAGQPHGYGKASSCTGYSYGDYPQIDAIDEPGMFLFGQAHGLQNMKWDKGYISIQEYNRSTPHGRESTWLVPDETQRSAKFENGKGECCKYLKEEQMWYGIDGTVQTALDEDANRYGPA